MLLNYIIRKSAKIYFQVLDDGFFEKPFTILNTNPNRIEVTTSNKNNICNVKSIIKVKFEARNELRPSKASTIPDTQISNQKFEEINLNKDSLKIKTKPISK